MKYGDFSSLVQLGVGLHLGTALLQLYGEIGVQPLVRTIARTRSLFAAPEAERPPKATEEALDRLENRFEIFKIRLFNEYKKYIVANSCVAVALAAVLVLIAFFADTKVDNGMDWAITLIVFFSLFPAPITLAVLWWDAGRLVKPMKKEADELERRALAGQ
jgi:hypothetical protein